jgi:hypothetical protein
MSYYRNLTFIDNRLNVMKQAHNQFMSGLVNVIMTNFFYQGFLVQDSWILT